MGHIVSSLKEATRLHRKTITADQNATNFQNGLRQYFRQTRTQSYITYDDFMGHVFEPKGKTQRQQARSIMTFSFIIQPRYNWLDIHKRAGDAVEEEHKEATAAKSLLTQ